MNSGNADSDDSERDTRSIDERSPGWTQPVHLLALLLALAAALAGAAAIDDRGSATPPRVAADEGDPAAVAELAIEIVPDVADRVEEIRGLRFEEVPLPRVVDSASWASCSPTSSAGGRVIPPRRSPPSRRWPGSSACSMPATTCSASSRRRATSPRPPGTRGATAST